MAKKTSSDIELKNFYGSSYNEATGEYPFTHGIYPNMYIDKKWDYLIDLCWYQFNFFREILGLGDKKVVRMSERKFIGNKDDLVLDHCKKLDCNAVIFGEMGKDYVDINKFSKNNILVYFQKYTYPKYSQLYNQNGFTSHLSGIDLILNEGPKKSLEIFKKQNLTIDKLDKSIWVNSQKVCL